MAGGVAFGIGEHGRGGGVTVAIEAAECEDGQSLPFQFVPVDGNDLAADKLLVVLALEMGGSGLRPRVLGQVIRGGDSLAHCRSRFQVRRE